MRRSNFVVLVAFILVVTANAFATAQTPDKIIYRGKQYMLHSNPLEAYFEKNPDKRPTSGMTSSALWRGYVATFEIADNALMLKDIEIMVSKKTEDGSFDYDWKSVIADVVPSGTKLKIDWMTGILVIPHGEIVDYVHMGYGSTFENYILIEVSNGDFVKAKEIGYKAYAAFRDRQFEAFKKTDEYKKLVEELKKDGKSSDEFIESFLRSFVISYSSKILVD